MKSSKPLNPLFRQTKLRAAAEARLASAAVPSPQAPAVLPMGGDELLHELQVQQVELEMQNDTLRQLQVELERSRDRFRDLYELSPVGYLTLSRDNTISEINLTACALLGRPRSVLLQRRLATLLAPEDVDRWHRYFMRALGPTGAPHEEFTLVHLDGTMIPARLDCRCVMTDAPRAVLRVAIIDLTESKLADEALRIAAVAFEAHDAILVTDAAGVILRVNSAFTRRTGYQPEEAIGKTPALLKSGRQSPSFYQQMWETLNVEGCWQGTIWNRHRNGKIYAELMKLSAVRKPDGGVSHYVGAYSDLAENKEAEAEVYRLAYYDPLTQLPNRRLLLDRLGQSLAGCARSGHYGAALFLDLDRFKTLNDTHGHDVGDLLLMNVARRLETGIRKENTVARLSGDEFIVVLEDLSSNAEEAALQAEMVAEKLRLSLSLPYDLGGPEFNCTASVGIALFHSLDIEPRDILKRADTALYQAKSAGRNSVRFFDAAMQIAQDERVMLANDLQQALALQQLQLHYQAQVDCARRVIGVEALLRWAHPEHGLLEPEVFVPLAEASGLILPIGEWVLASACAQIKAWSARAATETLQIAINISARQFRQPEFADTVQRALTASGANPARLVLELAEGLALNDLPDTLTKMQTLKAIGVSFALQGFGSSCSSLSILGSLPLERLKIEPSFIRKLDGQGFHANNAAITQGIISLGQMLGLQVLAEGVETETQFDFLTRHGCLAYQGHLFGQPVSMAAFEQVYPL